MTCEVCKKYNAGKTADKFRLWWSNYKESNRKFLRGDEIKQKSLHDLILQDSTHSFDPSDPHKREYYWMRTIKIIVPFTPNKHTKQYLQLRVFHQSCKFILLPKVGKSDYIVVTLLLLFNFFVL